MSDQQNPLSELAPELRAKLQQLESTIGRDGITVSFFMEDKDAFGRKKSAFNLIRVSHKGGEGASWTSDEAQVVQAQMSKEAVVMTYRDAVKRGFIAASTAKEEVTAICHKYDQTVVNLLKKGADEE